MWSMTGLWVVVLALLGVPRRTDAEFGSVFERTLILLKTEGQCEEPVTTATGCAQAALRLGLELAVHEDHEIGVTHDPPYCYIEFDDSSRPGVLRFNAHGTNKGECNTYDRCICQCRTGSRGGWLLGDVDQTCSQTCEDHGASCSASAMQAHNHEVDSPEGLAEVVTALGEYCEGFERNSGTHADVPVLLGTGETGQHLCFYSAPMRSEGSFRCDARVVVPDHRSKRRLCYCEVSHDLSSHADCPAARAMVPQPGQRVGLTPPALPQGGGVVGPVVAWMPGQAGLPLGRPLAVHASSPSLPMPPAPPTLLRPPTRPPQTPQAPLNRLPSTWWPQPSCQTVLAHCSFETSRAAMETALSMHQAGKTLYDVQRAAAAEASSRGCVPREAWAQEVARLAAARGAAVLALCGMRASEETLCQKAMKAWPYILPAVLLLFCLATFCCGCCGRQLRLKLRQKQRVSDEVEEEEQGLLSAGPAVSRNRFNQVYRIDRSNISSPATVATVASGGTQLSSPLRFSVGARVRCRMDDVWLDGQVVRTWYQDRQSPAGELVPYIIKLDNGSHCCCMVDDDGCIRDAAVRSEPSSPYSDRSHRDWQR